MSEKLKNLIEKISNATGMSEEDVRVRIREKQAELYGLISPEGAATILAKELGIDVDELEEYKISELKENMNNIYIKARVSRIFTRDFEKDGETKRVSNIWIIDETGETRLVLWNEQIDEYPLKEGDVIEIKNGYTRKNIFGEIEVRVGASGKINILPDDPSLPVGTGYKEEKINKMEVGGRYKTRASVVQVFNTNMIFEVCPECGSIIKNGACPVHGEVKPDYTVIISSVIDDGYGNMRVVFFRETAEKLLGKTTDEVKDNIENEVKKILGKEFILYGKVRKNEVFNRKEFVVDNVEEVNVKTEYERLFREIEELKKV